MVMRPLFKVKMVMRPLWYADATYIFTIIFLTIYLRTRSNADISEICFKR